MSDQTPPDDRPTGPVSGAHPDVDELSAYADGELDAARGPEVREHVASCAECTGDLRALHLVVAELAALPSPTMPTDVAARLDQAIARERRVQPAAGTDVLPRRRRSGPGWTTGAAAAVAIGLVAVIGIGAVSQLNSTQEDKPAAGTAGALREGGTAEQATTAVYDSGTNYAKDDLGRQLAATLSGQARDQLAVPAQPDQAPAAPGATESAPTRTRAEDSYMSLDRDPGRLQACLQAIDPEQTPVAVDFARFENKPALLVALPGDTDNTLWIFMVEPECGVADDAKVLYSRQVARP
jgi:anti-sigma factor RsiW